jgi:hypothetical protein
MVETPKMRIQIVRLPLLMASALLVAVGLSSCAIAQPRACASWVDYVTTAEMEEAASDVVVSDSVDARGTEMLFGVDAAAYDVTVAETHKGVIEPGREIRVISTPDSCGSNFYPEGDQLGGAGPLRLYLTKNDDGTFQTLTPFDGVESAP